MGQIKLLCLTDLDWEADSTLFFPLHLAFSSQDKQQPKNVLKVILEHSVANGNLHREISFKLVFLLQSLQQSTYISKPKGKRERRDSLQGGRKW